LAQEKEEKMLRYMTAGESHGKGLIIIIDGVPSGLKFDVSCINPVLAERQKGYGRGGRQKIETDSADIISGVRFGRTTGAPVSVMIKNRDFENWKKILSVSEISGAVGEFNVPRPGHADLSGGVKYAHHDFRNVLERASARETAARVVSGACAKVLLKEIGIDVFGYVINIAGVLTDDDTRMGIDAVKKRISELDKKYGANLRFPGENEIPVIIRKIRAAVEEGETLGGVVKVITSPLPMGLGDYTQWDKKLDAMIARSLMSIQAIKGVEFGLGFACAGTPGSKFHDSIQYSAQKGFYRASNNAGGMEGGMSDGEPLIVKAAMKPISTVRKGIDSVNARSKKRVKTVYERSDICAVPAAAIVAEAAVAFELANAALTKFGGDTVAEFKLNHNNYIKYVKNF
jgi:chorismate synthase